MRHSSPSSFANKIRLNEDHDSPPVNRTTHLIFRPSLSSKHPSGKVVVHRSSTGEFSEDTENESAGEAIDTGLGGRHRYGLNALENDYNSAIESSIRFHGRSSTASLVEVTRTFKHMRIQEEAIQSSLGDQDQNADKESEKRKPTLEKTDNAELRVFRRPEFWSAAKVSRDLYQTPSLPTDSGLVGVRLDKSQSSRAQLD